MLLIVVNANISDESICILTQHFVLHLHKIVTFFKKLMLTFSFFQYKLAKSHLAAKDRAPPSASDYWGLCPAWLCFQTALGSAFKL